MAVALCSDQAPQERQKGSSIRRRRRWRRNRQEPPTEYFGRREHQEKVTIQLTSLDYNVFWWHPIGMSSFLSEKYN